MEGRVASVLRAPVRDAVYRVYERRLLRKVDRGRLPRHVGVILDGNRRFAQEMGLPSVAHGHRLGAGRIHDLLDWCDELGIATISLWMLSTDNLQRDADEVRALAEIIADTVVRIAEERPTVRVTSVGALDTLPDGLARVLKETEDLTRFRTGPHVQVAVGYGGRREITDALRRLLEHERSQGLDLSAAIERLSPDAIAAHLYTTGVPDPELIIRTSGEIRLSGFLLWQSVHSEFYFCDAYWPAFRKIDFLRALRSFASRQRRFGR